MTIITRRLDEICEEVGLPLYKKWMGHALKECNASPYLYRGADAIRACLYEGVLKQYEHYKEIENAAQKAREVC